MARTNPLLTGDVLALQSAGAITQVRETDLLHESMGPSLLLSAQGEKLAGNSASLFLWDDAATKNALILLARQVATSGIPAVADIRTTGTPVRRLQVRAVPLSGPSAAVWCSATDMSVQDHLIEALKQSRTMFRDLAEAAGDFCAEVDSQGVIAYVSPGGALGHEAWSQMLLLVRRI
jgi:PAS domain-containing protein